MKRILTVALATAMFGILMGSASAGEIPKHNFAGRIQADPFTYISFLVKKVNGTRRVRNIYAAVPAHCHQGEGGFADVYVKGSLKVKKNGRFGGTLKSDFEGANFRFKLSGRLRGKVARGKLSTRGKYPGDARGGGKGPTVCYTGELRWRAKRGANPSIPREGLR